MIDSWVLLTNTDRHQMMSPGQEGRWDILGSLFLARRDNDDVTIGGAQTLTLRPRMRLMAALSLSSPSCSTWCLISFMKSMKAFRGFFTSCAPLRVRDIQDKRRERERGSHPAPSQRGLSQCSPGSYFLDLSHMGFHCQETTGRSEASRSHGSKWPQCKTNHLGGKSYWFYKCAHLSIIGKNQTTFKLRYKWVEVTF